MAKDSKKLVQAITSQEENFAQWYTDICVKVNKLKNQELLFIDDVGTEPASVIQGACHYDGSGRIWLVGKFIERSSRYIGRDRKSTRLNSSHRT